MIDRMAVAPATRNTTSQPTNPCAVSARRNARRAIGVISAQIAVVMIHAGFALANVLRSS